MDFAVTWLARIIGAAVGFKVLCRVFDDNNF
jgi:hypothetical protein